MSRYPATDTYKNAHSLKTLIKLLGRSETQIRRLLKTKEFEGAVFSPPVGEIRVSADAVEAYLKKSNAFADAKAQFLSLAKKQIF